MAEKHIKYTDKQDEPKKDERKTAIAVGYDVDKNKAPLILAAGKGPIADEILKLAQENKIPLYEDPELASLLVKIELDTEIPPELYTLVAEVLFFVYQLDKMAEKKERLLSKMREEEPK